MVGTEAQREPACDPEQAGIMLDRLAMELERAELNNPHAVAGLREDARQLLACVRDWLAGEGSELAASARIAPPGGIDVRSLRQLAEELLELADDRETMIGEFDPQSVAGALQVLETEVGPELFGEDAELAFVALRGELTSVVVRARAWAERRGFAPSAIPDVPPPSASKQDCMLALRHLAGVLDDLGLRAAKARDGS